MSLEQSLVLNRWMHTLLGAESVEDLQQALEHTEEGAADDGQSHFFHALKGRNGLAIREKLPEYDARIMAYEEQLRRTRRVEPVRSFKYFQYLALLYTEVFLDRLTDAPEVLLADLNRFRAGNQDFAEIPDFTADELRRIAFFMATGSGKTLLMHVNIRQVLHYLKHGKHPEALVRRADKRREFDRVVLITPGEGLSDQHLAELMDSGFEAVRLVEDRTGGDGMFGPKVRVIEIHKLAEEVSGDGVSIPLDELGDNNLIVVDEGHKGTSSDAKSWKKKQQTLGNNGFILEYSATYAQAVGAAGGQKRKALTAEYGKTILFDYSYRFFYGDGFGKAFEVLNLERGTARNAHELLVGGLLVYFQQLSLFNQNREPLREYNVEKPLWVLLGTSVSKKGVAEKDNSKTAKTERTDVAEVVRFLKRFLEDEAWAIDRIKLTLAGQSGFTDKDSKQDLFAEHIRHLPTGDARELYRQICEVVFRGRNKLEVCELKASGEIGLRVATPARDNPYFAVINIGDVGAFKKHLAAKVQVEVQEDNMRLQSLFKLVGDADSRVHMVIGAKKFIEGWSSWRVSAMGLMNVGKKEGSQVIQLFGRGVRLKGKNKSLKRSAESAGQFGETLKHLETLYIFGWNANFVRNFRETIDAEDVPQKIGKTLRVKVSPDPLPGWLWVPAAPEGYDPRNETWVLDASVDFPVLDLAPRLRGFSADGTGPRTHEGTAGQAEEVSFDGDRLGLLDCDALRASLLDYKMTRRYDNVFIGREAVATVLQSRCKVRISTSDVSDPVSLQEAAGHALRLYLDKFVRRMEREAETNNCQPRLLDRQRHILSEYEIRVRAGDKEGKRLLKAIRELLAKDVEELCQSSDANLPRLKFDRHLFNPVLTAGNAEWSKRVAVRPPPIGGGEHSLVKDLRDFWRDNRNQPPYRDWEVYLLRNLPMVGIGLYSRSGFFPDFILWVRHRQTKAIHLRFLDPHGLHHEGLGKNQDRFDAIAKLPVLSQKPAFCAQQVSMDAKLLVSTELEDIPDRGNRSWPELQREYPLVHQQDGGDYIKMVLNFI
ncbi:MAG: hypothetical protein PCFJNLEI_00674 [Verrucomicrobiae bacterium]|nr:hypothetical protein [Verrucomicrobiae bacterium]